MTTTSEPTRPPIKWPEAAQFGDSLPTPLEPGETRRFTLSYWEEVFTDYGTIPPVRKREPVIASEVVFVAVVAADSSLRWVCCNKVYY